MKSLVMSLATLMPLACLAGQPRVAPVTLQEVQLKANSNSETVFLRWLKTRPNVCEVKVLSPRKASLPPASDVMFRFADQRIPTIVLVKPPLWIYDEQQEAEIRELKRWTAMPKQELDKILTKRLDEESDRSKPLCKNNKSKF